MHKNHSPETTVWWDCFHPNIFSWIAQNWAFFKFHEFLYSVVVNAASCNSNSSQTKFRIWKIKLKNLVACKKSCIMAICPAILSQLSFTSCLLTFSLFVTVFYGTYVLLSRNRHRSYDNWPIYHSVDSKRMASNEGYKLVLSFVLICITLKVHWFVL